MNTQNAAQNMHKIFHQNFIFYLTGFLVIFGMKYFYSNADCDDLVWILAPIAKWVELLSGIPFEYAPDAGYANHSLRLLIAPSCSGVQFMIITIAMLIFSFVHRVTTAKYINPPKLHNRLLKGFCWIIVSIVLSYLCTIFVNGLRIIAAIYLPIFLGEAIYSSFLTPDRLHTIIGIIVYFTALLTIYRLTEYFFSRNGKLSEAYLKAGIHRSTHLPQFIRKCLSPVFWYFSIALGIPFLNNAYEKSNGKYTELTFLIFCCCTAILTLYNFMLFIGSRLKKDRRT